MSECTANVVVIEASVIAKAAVFLHFAADALIETVRHPAIIIGKQALHYAMNRSLQIAIRAEIASARFFQNINILARHRLMALGTEQLSAMAVRAVKNLLAQCTDLEMITAAAAANLPARRFLHIFAQVEHLVARLIAKTKQRAEAYKRVAEAKATAKYMDEKAAHYEAILAGLAPDDTNPRNWTAENRPQHEHK